MYKRSQYQPVGGGEYDTSAAKEVIYSKEFKKADIAGGYRKPKLQEAKNSNPQLP
ncbi:MULTISPECIES: YfhE family protein [Pontibacillus]|uniref:YfhE family protein n=1 Tax=Pontibacillus TaxID=289201 RepID=UPI001A97C57C|nr:YfhE family protein [Pontibacillus sp. ALD_SL1]QST01145.1 YfhE family protein [Pontibacillus sp. ALD_SL1]